MSTQVITYNFTKIVEKFDDIMKTRKFTPVSEVNADKES